MKKRRVERVTTVENDLILKELDVILFICCISEFFRGNILFSFYYTLCDRVIYILRNNIFNIIGLVIKVQLVNFLSNTIEIFIPILVFVKIISSGYVIFEYRIR